MDLNAFITLAKGAVKSFGAVGDYLTWYYEQLNKLDDAVRQEAQNLNPVNWFVNPDGGSSVDATYPETSTSEPPPAGGIKFGAGEYIPAGGGAPITDISGIEKLLIETGLVTAEQIKGYAIEELVDLALTLGVITKGGGTSSGGGGSGQTAAQINAGMLAGFDPATDLIDIPGTNFYMIRQTGELIEKSALAAGAGNWSSILKPDGTPTGYMFNTATGDSINADGNAISWATLNANIELEKSSQGITSQNNIANQNLSLAQLAESARNNIVNQQLEAQAQTNAAVENIAALGADPGNFVERDYTIRGLQAPAPAGSNTYDVNAAISKLMAGGQAGQNVDFNAILSNLQQQTGINPAGGLPPPATKPPVIPLPVKPPTAISGYVGPTPMLEGGGNAPPPQLTTGELRPATSAELASGQYFVPTNQQVYEYFKAAGVPDYANPVPTDPDALSFGSNIPNPDATAPTSGDTSGQVTVNTATGNFTYDPTLMSDPSYAALVTARIGSTEPQQGTYEQVWHTEPLSGAQVDQYGYNQYGIRQNYTPEEQAASAGAIASTGNEVPDYSTPVPESTSTPPTAVSEPAPTGNVITPEAQAFMDAHPEYSDAYKDAGVPGYAMGTGGMLSGQIDPNLTPQGTTTAPSFIAGDTQNPGVPNPEQVDVIDPAGPNNAQARVTPLSGQMGQQMSNQQAGGPQPQQGNDGVVKLLSGIIQDIGNSVPTYAKGTGAEKRSFGLSTAMSHTANAGPKPTTQPKPNTRPMPPAYAEGTNTSYLSSVLQNLYGFSPQPDVNIQNLPSISELQGGAYGTLSTSPTFEGAFGTQLPEARAINYGAYQRLSQDPSSYGLLSSLYRSGSRNLQGEAAIAKRYAPIGNASRLIRT